MQENIAKRLYEAWTHERGCRLNCWELDYLLRDDAVATAISNAAVIVEPGTDCLLPRMVDEEWTWEQFQRYLSTVVEIKKEAYLRSQDWFQNDRGWWHPPDCLAAWPMAEAFDMAQKAEAFDVSQKDEPL